MKRLFHPGLSKFSQFLRSSSTASFVPKAYQDSKLIHAEKDAKKGWVDVEWADGKKGRFVFPWLRENSPVDHTYNLSSTNKARSLLIKDLDVRGSPDDFSWSPEGLRLVWEAGRVANYSADWLRARNLSDPDIRTTRPTEIYKCVEYESWPSDAKHENVTWASLMEGASETASACERLLRFGFLLVTEIPDGPGRINELSSLLGYFHTTHFGNLFHVKPKEEASNLAYTAKALGLHTDLPQMTEPPQVQALHCLLQSKHGGANTFADGFRVAEALAAEKPRVHEILSRTPFEYIDWGVEENRWHYMANAWPVLQHDYEGRLEAVFYNNQIRSWFLRAPPEEHAEIYAALRTFDDYCYQPRHKLSLKLRAGQMVLFANNRVLHGREATGNDRHYEGCYFTFDAFRSKIRTIREGSGVATHASY